MAQRVTIIGSISVRSIALVLSPLRLLRAYARFALGGLNALRLRFRTRTARDVAIGNVSAHNFGLITLFTSVGEQLRQAQECGF